MPSSINLYLWVGQHSANYRLAVDVLIKTLIECLPWVGQVSIKMQSIYSPSQMPLTTHDPANNDLKISNYPLRNVLPGNTYFQ